MPTTSSHTLQNRVHALLDRLVDIGDGYDLIIEHAPASIRDLVAKIAEQHSKDIAEIEHLASERDIALDRDCADLLEGDRIATRLRDVFADTDQSTLNAIVIGEEIVVKRYDEAIACLAADDDMHGILMTQRDELRNKVARIFEAV